MKVLCLNGKDHVAAIRRSLAFVSSLTGKIVDHQAQNIINLFCEIAVLLNPRNEMVNPDLGDVESVAWEVMLGAYPELRPFSKYLLAAGCKKLILVKRLAKVCDANISTLLLHESSWSSIVEYFRVPEISKEEFLLYCTRNGCVKIIFAIAIQGFTAAKSSSKKASIILEVSKWIQDSIFKTENGKDVLALVSQVIMWLPTLKVESHRQAFNCYCDFLTCVDKISSDRRTDGFWGQIGLGAKNCFTATQRLFLQAIRAYMDAICDKDKEKILWSSDDMLDFCTKSRTSRRGTIWADFEKRVCGKKSFKPYERQIHNIVAALDSWICLENFNEYIILMLKELHLEMNSFFLATSARVKS